MLTNSLKKWKTFPRYYVKIRTADTHLSIVINNSLLSLERGFGVCGVCVGCCSNQSWSSSSLEGGAASELGCQATMGKTCTNIFANSRKHGYNLAILFPFSLPNLHIKVHWKTMGQFTIYFNLYSTAEMLLRAEKTHECQVFLYVWNILAC